MGLVYDALKRSRMEADRQCLRPNDQRAESSDLMHRSDASDRDDALASTPLPEAVPVNTAADPDTADPAPADDTARPEPSSEPDGDVTTRDHADTPAKRRPGAPVTAPAVTITFCLLVAACLAASWQLKAQLVHVGSPNLVAGRSYGRTLALPGLPRLELEGILWSPNKALAVINGITVTEGSHIEGAAVLAIERDRVRLSIDSTDFYLRRG